MKRFAILCLFAAFAGNICRANNIRVDGDVRVTGNDVSGNIATVNIKLQWDNSWRDAFNYDAAYVFVKYKVDGEGELWHHATLMSDGHTVTPGYETLLSNTTGETDKNQGIFVYRSGKGVGSSVVELKLRWNITGNPNKVLNTDLFISNRVFITAMGIEMVYIPRGGFRAGDTRSVKKFEYKDVTFPAKYDLLTTDLVREYYSSKSRELVSDPNPPAFAINGINDVNPEKSNAWVGRTDTPEGVDYDDFWQVSFTQPVVLRSIAIESIAGGVPAEWKLEASTTSGWRAIYPVNYQDDIYALGSEWATGSHRTYPCTRTLRIPDDPENEQGYSTYRITIKGIPAGGTVIKNVSMGVANVLDSVDNSVVIDGPQSRMHNRYGLYAEDGDTWSGLTDVNYPNGYGAFFAMKYEITQEQYVTFLNKLTAAQQRNRTIGAVKLESLLEGQYVFGDDKNNPTARNGIKLASIGVNDAPYVFANDLNPLNEYAQDGDGQTIACNFLNGGDMLAYADWVGLRPLTELEYEKMARRPFPEHAIRGEYAWNQAVDATKATGFFGTTVGKKTERPASGNVNMENGQEGPLRVGSFAASSGGQVAAGASFWGLMELSGNLGELYYNANTVGRGFRGMQNIHHGNGQLAADGNTDVLTDYWPWAEQAFSLRGGSYQDVKERVRISDRERNLNVFGSISEVTGMKSPTMTFRLGRTAPVLTLISELVLENGQSTAMNAIDSVCSGVDYIIKGTIPKEITGSFRIAWFMSSDKGTTWDLMEGEEQPSLNIKNLRNINLTQDLFMNFRFRRRIFSDRYDVVTTNDVEINVINNSLIVSNNRDTLDVYDRSKGFRVETPQAATFAWTWLRSGVNNNRPITPEYPAIVAGKVQRHFFAYTDFEDGAMFLGTNKILLEVTVMKKCPLQDTLYVFVEESPSPQDNGETFVCGNILQFEEERYRTIEIGGRCWFADNLRRTPSTGSYKCYDESLENCKKYGYLYNYQAVAGQVYSDLTGSAKFQGICPPGWHVPSNPEWLDLLTAIGQNPNTRNNALKLQSPLNDWGWNSSTAAAMTDEAKIGTNESGFSALPAGGRFFASNTGYNPRMWTARNGFGDLHSRGWWWTSSVALSTWGGNRTNDRNVAMIPYHVTLNFHEETKLGGGAISTAPSNMTYLGNTLYTNTLAGGSTYGYLTNSVLNAYSYAYLYTGENQAGWNSLYNTAAGNNIWQQFYFSVRCIRNY